jgi:hypothetical protein
VGFCGCIGAESGDGFRELRRGRGREDGDEFSMAGGDVAGEESGRGGAFRIERGPEIARGQML